MKTQTTLYATTIYTFETGDAIDDYAGAREKALLEAEKLYTSAEGYEHNVANMVTVDGLPVIEIASVKK